MNDTITITATASEFGWRYRVEDSGRLVEHGDLDCDGTEDGASRAFVLVVAQTTSDEAEPSAAEMQRAAATVYYDGSGWRWAGGQ